MFKLEIAGGNATEYSMDVFTKGGSYAGIISQKAGHCRAYFNDTATKGSKRKFPNAQAAAEFLYQRRIKKGWTV